jgi:WD40 repeat protein
MSFGVGTKGETIQFWDTATGQLRDTLITDPDPTLIHTAYYSGGTTLAAVSRNGFVRLWNPPRVPYFTLLP